MDSPFRSRTDHISAAATAGHSPLAGPATALTALIVVLILAVLVVGGYSRITGALEPPPANLSEDRAPTKETVQ